MIFDHFSIIYERDISPQKRKSTVFLFQTHENTILNEKEDKVKREDKVENEIKIKKMKDAKRTMICKINVRGKEDCLRGGKIWEVGGLSEKAFLEEI